MVGLYFCGLFVFDLIMKWVWWLVVSMIVLILVGFFSFGCCDFSLCVRLI